MEFHGVDGDFTGDAVDRLVASAPPRPADVPAVKAPEGHEKTWPRVHFRGFTGRGELNCDHFRQFDRYNVPNNRIGGIAWAAFGLCNHQVICYDEAGFETVLTPVRQ